MSEKKIGGYTASALLDAVEHLAKVEKELGHLQWRLCFYDDPANSFANTAFKARAHSRDLLRALDRLHTQLQIEKDEADDQGRAIRAVK